MKKAIQIYDTTLRDGTQSMEVNLTVQDKLEMVKALDSLGIDYIELGWPGSNPKDRKAFDEVRKLKLKTAKITAFGSTRKIGLKAREDSNLKSILDSKVKVAAIFGKTWLLHVEKQLNCTKKQNLEAIYDSIKHLKKHKLEVFYDAEHYFDGFKDNKEYVFDCLKTAYSAGADMVVLCDTNGGTLTDEVEVILKETLKYLKKNRIKAKLGVHFHNDSDVAVANSLISSGYISQIQGTINGIGERAGNANLCSIMPALILKGGYQTNIRINRLTDVSRKLNLLANLNLRNDQPYVGKNAFSHKGGIHVDAISKGATYEFITPALVGNNRSIVLSDLSGSANIVEVVKKFGYTVNKKDSRVKAMLEEVKLLESKGYRISDIKAEQYLLTDKHFNGHKRFFEIEDVKFLSEVRDGKDYNECVIVGTVDGKNREVVFPVKGAFGGPVDSAYKCLQKMIATNYKQIKDVSLVNYKVMIVVDKGHESAVRVYVGFKDKKEEWSTNGVDTNILKASLEAIEKGFRYYLLKRPIN